MAVSPCVPLLPFHSIGSEGGYKGSGPIPSYQGPGPTAVSLKRPLTQASDTGL